MLANIDTWLRKNEQILFVLMIESVERYAAATATSFLLARERVGAHMYQWLDSERVQALQLLSKLDDDNGDVSSPADRWL